MKIPVFFFTILFFCFTGILFAQGIGSNDLIKSSRQYDGKTVVYSGEVIGDIMKRNNFAWINVHDGDNAIGIWINGALAKEINFCGGYKSWGDKVEIIGIFHRACPEHGADLDIHAQSIRKIQNGRVVAHRLNTDKKNLTLILLGILIFIWISTLFKKR